MSELYEQNKRVDQGLEERRQQMNAAKKMVRELKGKEQAIKWGILRNEKKVVKKTNENEDANHRKYYEEIRRQFIEFIS